MDGWGPKVSPGNFSPASFRDRPEVVGLFERLFELQPPDAYIRSVEILLGASATAVVPTVTVPVCSVSGADDQYAPPDAVQAFVSAFPRPPQPVILPSVGHLPFFEAPVAFARAVGTFLEASFPS
jgi:pimeloyl-ACP methyl ester carboxylesterase